MCRPEGAGTSGARLPSHISSCCFVAFFVVLRGSSWLSWCPLWLQRDGGPALGHLADARQRFLDVGERCGVAETQVAVAVAAEGGAAEAGDAGVVEQQVGELAARHAGAADVREGVERAVGKGAAEA